jgi:hypothetical protein
MQAEALSMLLRLGAMRGSFAGERPHLAKLQALCEAENKQKLDPFVRLVTMMAIAEFSLREGSLQEAQVWIDRTQALAAQLGATLPVAVRVVATLLTGVLQLQGGQIDAAVNTMQSAHDFMAAAEGPRHPVTALLSLDLAMALDAKGDTEAALRIVADVEPVLREAMGRSSATYRKLERLSEAMQRRLETRPSAPNGASLARPVPSPANSPVLATRDFFI